MTDPERPAVKAERRAVRRAVIVGVIRAVATVVAIVVAYFAFPVSGGSGADSIVRMVFGGLFLVAVSAWEVRAVATSPRPAIRAIDALAVSVTTVIVVFAVFYLNLSARDPGAFNQPLGRTSAMYFTMTTLTTIGYGDIVAATDTARVAVMVQMLFNVAVIGTTARLIVGTARRERDRRRD